jgi:hypothetical protein
VATEFGYETTTIDNDQRFNPDILADILLWQPKGYYDVIWSSPPCTTFSVASIGTHWKGVYEPKTEEARIGIKLLNKTIKIIRLLKPKYFFIENPRGVMRKVISGLPEGTIRHTISYCQYGDTRMKPTDIWTNLKEWKPKPICKNGDTCHQSAPRGSRTGTQGLKNAQERGIVPKFLCEEIIKTIMLLTNERYNQDVEDCVKGTFMENIKCQ